MTSKIWSCEAAFMLDKYSNHWIGNRKNSKSWCFCTYFSVLSVGVQRASPPRGQSSLGGPDLEIRQASASLCPSLWPPLFSVLRSGAARSDTTTVGVCWVLRASPTWFTWQQHPQTAHFIENKEVEATKQSVGSYSESLVNKNWKENLHEAQGNREIHIKQQKTLEKNNGGVYGRMIQQWVKGRSGNDRGARGANHRWRDGAGEGSKWKNKEITKES